MVTNEHIKTMVIPDELTPQSSNAIDLFFYETIKESTKQQVLLNQNTFSFLQEGVKNTYFQNTSCTIDSSQFLLMRSGNYLMTEKLSQSANYKSTLFFFSTEKVIQFVTKFNIDITTTPIFQSSNTFKYDAYIRGFVKSLLDISKLSPSTRKGMLEVKFEEIMLYLVEHYGADFLHSLIVDSNMTKQKFRQTVENNKTNKLTLHELAFLSNMSLSTFKREFEKQFGCTPMKWFQERRLEHVALLLKDKSIRVSDVYEEAGYENPSSFIQAFKIKFGITPKQYQLSS